MSTKKRVRPSPAADSAQPDIDDAALRKALADKKRAKSKAAFDLARSVALFAISRRRVEKLRRRFRRAGHLPSGEDGEEQTAQHEITHIGTRSRNGGGCCALLYRRVDLRMCMLHVVCRGLRAPSW